jgi:hypothetical protein
MESSPWYSGSLLNQLRLRLTGLAVGRVWVVWVSVALGGRSGGRATRRPHTGRGLATGPRQGEALGPACSILSAPQAGRSLCRILLHPVAVDAHAKAAFLARQEAFVADELVNAKLEAFAVGGGVLKRLNVGLQVIKKRGPGFLSFGAVWRRALVKRSRNAAKTGGECAWAMRMGNQGPWRQGADPKACLHTQLRTHRLSAWDGLGPRCSRLKLHTALRV